MSGLNILGVAILLLMVIVGFIEIVKSTGWPATIWVLSHTAIVVVLLVAAVLLITHE